MLDEVAPGVALVRDTCNVYVLPQGDSGIAVDFGSGAVLDRLGELGIERITDVLLTHHHRDQVQGLRRAVDHGARIWSPPLESRLIAEVDRHWQCRGLDRDYDLTDDRFSLREEVPIAGAVDEYRTSSFDGLQVYTLPTPGHTLGSVSYLVEREGRLLAFTGDLVYGDGQLWSAAATQWTYSGVEGQAATVVSAHVLARRRPDLLLPSHGPAVEDPSGSLAALQRRIVELIDLRLGEPSGLLPRIADPFDPITPHLLRNRVSFANSYALVSDSGAALLIDFGYDSAPWQRALLWSLEALKEQYNVDRIEAVVTTHYHDDHVAGLNLVRAVEGTQVWSPANVAPILESPHRYDLPCLWPEPIAVDRVLDLGAPISWHEYELTAHPFPGHTLYAASIAFEVDGTRVLAIGDQYATAPQDVAVLNYQYRNRFRRHDFVETAQLVSELRPDLLISGHWLPRAVDDALLDELRVQGERIASLHDELLPAEGLADEGFIARIEPYRSAIERGGETELVVTVQNPFATSERVHARLALPDGFEATPVNEAFDVPARGEATARFTVRAGGRPTRRARVAVDLTIGTSHFGEQAEALIDVA